MSVCRKYLSVSKPWIFRLISIALCLSVVVYNADRKWLDICLKPVRICDNDLKISFPRFVFFYHLFFCPIFRCMFLFFGGLKMILLLQRLMTSYIRVKFFRRVWFLDLTRQCSCSLWVSYMDDCEVKMWDVVTGSGQCWLYCFCWGCSCNWFVICDISVRSLTRHGCAYILERRAAFQK